VCVAHVTNSMAAAGDDFDKGEADGAADGNSRGEWPMKGHERRSRPFEIASHRA